MAHVEERRRLATLGSYSTVDGTTSQYLPTATGDPHSGVTSVHESIHRDLSVASEVGFFERILGRFLALRFSRWQWRRRRRQHQIKKVVGRLVMRSWMAHESAATYFSIRQIFKGDDAALANYLAQLPSDYRQAYNVYASVLDPHLKDSLAIDIGCQLAKNVSRAALDVPIVGHFPSFGSVTPRAVDRFLDHHDPDRVQRRIVDRLTERNTTALLDHGRAFLREKGSHSGPSDLQLRVQLFSELDLLLLRQLRTMFPDLVATDVAQQQCRGGGLVGRWRSELEEYGLVLLYTYDDPAADSAQETDGLLDRVTDIGSRADSPFGSSTFQGLALADVDKWIGSLAKVEAHLLVSVLLILGTNTSGKSTRDDSYPPYALLYTWPWQWEGEDRIESISEAMTFDPYLGHIGIKCPWREFSAVARALRPIPTVWLRMHENEAFLPRVQLRMPDLIGWNVVYRKRSSARGFLTACSALAQKDPWGWFIYAREGDADLPEVLFAGLLWTEAKEMRLFPMVTASLVPLLSELDGRSWPPHVPDLEFRDCGAGAILDDLVSVFFSRNR